MLHTLQQRHIFELHVNYIVVGAQQKAHQFILKQNNLSKSTLGILRFIVVSILDLEGFIEFVVWFI